MAKEEMTESGLFPEEAKNTEEQPKATETVPVQETKQKDKKADKEAPAKQANAEQETLQETQTETAKPAKQEQAEKSKGDTGIPAFLESYRKAYPKEKAFHVTTDKQVFLEKDLSLARLHQRGLKNEGKVQTIKVK